MKVSILIGAALSLLVAGCSSTKLNEIKVQDKEIVRIVIPSPLLVRCTPDLPIDKVEYLKLAVYDRELYLTNYILSLYGTIAICNNQLDGISNLNKSEINNDSK